MLNRKFFTYASLLALVAVPTVVEEVVLQQHPVYAEEVLAPKAETPAVTGVKEAGAATTPLTTIEDTKPAPTTSTVPQEAAGMGTEEMSVSPEVLANANGSQPISQVRTSPEGKPYTVTGKIISVVNGWGGNGFYIQDSNGTGLYIYPGKDLGYASGDIIQLTGTLTNFKGELQLKSITAHKKLEGQLPTPVKETTIPELEKANPSTLVKLSNVTVGEIASDKYETSSFKVTDKDGQSVAVRLDNRTGIKTSDLAAKIGSGDVINLTAILSTVDGNLQLKPFTLDQFEV